MYLVRLKTIAVDAMRQTLDSDYVEPDLRNLAVSIEFPVARQDYPSVWVAFSPEGSLEPVGVGHVEHDDQGDEGGLRAYHRWRFQGYLSYTAVALTSLERDRMYDELVRIMAFGQEYPQTAEFRAAIEDNEFIALNIDFDQIGHGPITETPGTPWGSDDMVYEATVTMECFGEFVSDGSATLAAITGLVVIPYAEGEADPTDPDGGWQ